MRNEQSKSSCRSRGRACTGGANRQPVEWRTPCPATAAPPGVISASYDPTFVVAAMLSSLDKGLIEVFVAGGRNRRSKTGWEYGAVSAPPDRFRPICPRRSFVLGLPEETTGPTNRRANGWLPAALPRGRDAGIRQAVRSPSAGRHCRGSPTFAKLDSIAFPATLPSSSLQRPRSCPRRPSCSRSSQVPLVQERRGRPVA